MDLELKSKWTTALRSGDYKQGPGALRRGGKYCCLGVLHDVAGGEWTQCDLSRGIDEFAIKSDGMYEGALNTALLPDDLEVSYEIEGHTSALMAMNDQGHWSFNDIADWIDKNI